MYAYKDLLELAGYTNRIYSLLSRLHNLPPVKDFQYNQDAEKPQVVLHGVQVRPPCVPGVKGSEVLVAPLELRIEKGEHLMITGPVCVTGLTALITSLTLAKSHLEWSGQDGHRARPSGTMGSLPAGLLYR